MDLPQDRSPEEKPILAGLREVGFDVEHIQDLYEQYADYKRATPLLVSWMPRVEDNTAKEMLVRAVTRSRGTRDRRTDVGPRIRDRSGELVRVGMRLR